MGKISFSNGDARAAAFQLNQNSNALSKTFQRLSSGVRINSASDDAAGEALASKLESVAAVYFQGYKNSNDAQSYYAQAEEATDTLVNILEQIQSYAQTAQSSSISQEQRDALNTEVASLRTHYNEIVSDTSYNSRSIFAAANHSLTVGVGNSTITTSISAVLTEQIPDGTLTQGSVLNGGNGLNAVTEVYDVNGDGDLDIVSIDSSFGVRAPRVNIFLGNGNGTFDAPTSYMINNSVNSQSRYLVLKDVNNDGNADLITTDDNQSSVVVLLGNGNGSFNAPRSYVGITGAYHIEVGDFNEDGVDDLAIGSFATNNVSIMIGNGNGTFKARTSTDIGGGNYGLQVGDVNNDGNLDLISAVNTTASISVLLGNGNGTFKANYSMAFTGSVGNVLEDFNGDGNLDIVSTSNSTGGLQVFIGNGNGTFSRGISISLSATTLHDPSTADLNGDGHSDIFVVDNTGYKLYTMFGNGNGTFLAGRSYSTGSYMGQQLGYGDLDEDGSTDVVTSVTGGSTVVLYGNMETGTSGVAIESLSALSLDDVSSAEEAEALVEEYLNDVYVVKGAINGAASRYESAASYALGQAEGNQFGAEQIRSIDAAAELAAMIAQQIKVSGSIAVFAQANLSLPKVLSLLGED